MDKNKIENTNGSSLYSFLFAMNYIPNNVKNRNTQMQEVFISRSRNLKLIRKDKRQINKQTHQISWVKRMNQTMSSKTAQKRRTAYVRASLWLLLSIATKANNAIAKLISNTPLNRAPRDPINAQPILKTPTRVNYISFFQRNKRTRGKSSYYLFSFPLLTFYVWVLAK